jgi:hypothetical protein
MTDHSTAIVTPAARWSFRLALFSAALLLAALVLHRLASLSTPLALNLFAVGYALAALAMLLALVALARIWRTGYGGAGSAAVGLVLPVLTLAGPLVFVTAHADRPRINDVTTDWTTPPAFAALAKRAPGENSSAYPGQAFADLQAKSYPDLRTLALDRPVEEAFELVEEAVRRLRWRVAAAEPPKGGKGTRTGTIEATDHTLIVGFPDDIVVRVEGGSARTRIDVRSASRYGKSDFGQNAARLRRFLAEVRARADATATGVAGARGRTARARALLKLKQQKARDQQKAEGRSGRGRAQ